MRILEVGGGTGGTTAWLLPELNGVPALEYHFTDISALFTRRAQQKFADYDFVKYSELDLEKEAQSQGFQAQSYDLIVAANVFTPPAILAARSIICAPCSSRAGAC